MNWYLEKEKTKEEAKLDMEWERTLRRWSKKEDNNEGKKELDPKRNIPKRNKERKQNNKMKTGRKPWNSTLYTSNTWRCPPKNAKMDKPENWQEIEKSRWLRKEA